MAESDSETPPLPWRGLGLSSNLDARASPNPYSLLDRSPGLFDFVEYSAPLDVAQAAAEASLWPTLWARRAEVPVLYHPVHLNLYGPELASPEDLAGLDAHARAVDSAWVGNDVGWWHSRGRPFPGYLYLAPPLTEEGVEDCAAHARHAQSALTVPLALENPAVIAVRGAMHVLDFMARLHQQTGCPLLLDLGHLFSFQLARGLPLTAGWDGFPFEQVIEIHLAGGAVARRGERLFYVDDHTQPVREELFGLLEQLLPRCPRVRAVTFEGDGIPEAIATQILLRLRRLVPSAGAAIERSVPSRAPPGKSGYRWRTRPWQVFQETFGTGAEHGDNSVGRRAESEVRAAVLAQALDAAWPLSRLLVCGEPGQLEAYAASPEFRAAFEEGGADAVEAFAAYARRLVRERRDEAAAAGLALETWAHGLRPASAAEATWALEPGLSLGRFPFDLSELLFAAGAVRRHLTQRAWAAGTLDVEGLKALRQVALRPGPGPWPVAVRRAAGRLELIPLTASLERALEAVRRGADGNPLQQDVGMAEARRLGLIRRRSADP